jgi:hypothetical protein
LGEEKKKEREHDSNRRDPDRRCETRGGAQIRKHYGDCTAGSSDTDAPVAHVFPNRPATEERAGGRLRQEQEKRVSRS